MKLGMLLPKIKNESSDCDIFVEIGGVRYPVESSVNEPVGMVPGKRNIVLTVKVPEVPEEPQEPAELPEKLDVTPEPPREFEQPTKKVAAKGKSK